MLRLAQDTPPLDSHERLFAAALKLAIKDATRHKQEHTRYEAAQWLWTIAPTVAQRAGVPPIASDNANAI